MPQKIWTVGEEVLAADFNTYVQTQVVAAFANTAARDTWTSPPNGALCVTIDTNTVWLRAAGAWAQTMVTTRSFALATFTGAATNGAQVPWSVTSQVGGWASATNIAVPAGQGGLYAVTVNVVYTAGTVTASAYYTITAGGESYAIAHAGVGGAAATITKQLTAAQTITVTVTPGNNMGGSNMSLNINRIGP